MNRSYTLLLQPVINIGLDARVEIFGGLGRIPAQLPTTLTPSTRVASHERKVELVRLGVQVRLAQLYRFRRRHLPTRMKGLADRFDHGELPILPTLQEIVSVTARGGLFSGYDRVKEKVIELANLTYFKTCRSTSNSVE